MPKFLEDGVGIHEQGDERVALVSARDLVVDQSGRIEEPSAHPAERLRLRAPDLLAAWRVWVKQTRQVGLG
jgi:hypothetical protein